MLHDVAATFAQIGMLRNKADPGACDCLRFFWEYVGSDGIDHRGVWGSPAIGSSYPFLVIRTNRNDSLFPWGPGTYMKYNPDGGEWNIPPDNNEPVPKHPWVSPDEALSGIGFMDAELSDEAWYPGDDFMGTTSYRVHYRFGKMQRSIGASWIDTDLNTAYWKWVKSFCWAQQEAVSATARNFYTSPLDHVC